jgi:hypothetical protein
MTKAIKWKKSKEDVERGYSWVQTHDSSNGYHINATVSTDGADGIGQSLQYRTFVNLYSPDGTRIKHFRQTWIRTLSEAKTYRKDYVTELSNK